MACKKKSSCLLNSVIKSKIALRNVKEHCCECLKKKIPDTMLYYLKRETFARRQNDLNQGCVASQPGKTQEKQAYIC